MHDLFKIAIREAQGDLGVRTKNLAGAIAKELESKLSEDDDFVAEFASSHGKASEEAKRIAKEKAESIANAVLHLIGLTPKESDEVDDDSDEQVQQKAEYLLYIGQNDIESLAKKACENWEKLTELTQSIDSVLRSQDDAKAKKNKKKATRKDIESLPGFDGLAKPFKLLLKRKNQKGKIAYAADIALRGRMIADDKDMKVDSASQIAHMISTNKMRVDNDFFTAVDDLPTSSGAEMLGDLGMTSACYYSYANVDVWQLYENLGADKTLLIATLKGFISSFYSSFPSGKQNSTAGFNYPCYVRIIVKGKNLPTNLVNAFQKPVVPDAQISLEEASITALEKRLQQERKMHGSLAGFDAIIAEEVATLYPTLIMDKSENQIADNAAKAIANACAALEKEFTNA